MKKRLHVMIVALMFFLAACGTSQSQPPKDEEEKGTEEKQASVEVVKVGITQIVEHPSLDATREGFVAALADHGFLEGENLEVDFQSAQGDPNAGKTIAEKFVGDNVDLILAISTPSAQSALSATKEIPVIFTAITDPIGAQLVESFENPGGNATGASDTHPDTIPSTMKAIKEFFPDAKSVGIIYNAGEQNSAKMVEIAKDAMEPLGLKAVEATISTSAEVQQAAQSLVGRADVIYIPKDNTAITAFQSVVQLANDEDIPLFAGESDSVKSGAFAGYGFDYFDLGYQTGVMAIEVLKNGKSPSEIPVQYPNMELKLVLNEKAAKEQGIDLTEEMKQNATIIEE